MLAPMIPRSGRRGLLSPLYAMSVLVTFIDAEWFIAPEHLIGRKVVSFRELDDPIPQVGRALLTIRCAPG